MAARGRIGWQEDTGYGERSLVETAMGRDKTIIGAGLRARSLPGQRAEAAAGVAVLNRMLHKRTAKLRPPSTSGFLNSLGKGTFNQIGIHATMPCSGGSNTLAPCYLKMVFFEPRPDLCGGVS